MLKSLKHLLVQVKVLLIIEIGNKNISLEYSGMYKIIALLHIFRHMISTKNLSSIGEEQTSLRGSAIIVACRTLKNNRGLTLCVLVLVAAQHRVI